MRNIISLIFTISVVLLSAQNRKQFHSFVPDAICGYQISKWNIDPSDLPEYYVEELSDNEGRVIELKFCRFDSILKSPIQTCIPTSRVQYSYPDDQTVICSFLTYEGLPSVRLTSNCWHPSTIKFSLSDDQDSIISSRILFEIDTTLLIKQGYKKESLKSVFETCDEWIRLYDEINYVHAEIPMYSKSINKLKGHYPVSKNFDIERKECGSYTVELKELKNCWK